MTHKIIQQLRRERLALEIRQGTLAGTVGMSQNHMCNLEKGQNIPRLDMLESWANALGYELALVKKQ